ncbi:MAG: hypothetical protein E7012_05910 [Alphaproteobacteria bacterium]|nr:hypothetical protein [Alphaproteobacteria bacterium]
MILLNNKYQRTLIILWLVAFIAIGILLFYGANIENSSVYKNSVIIFILLIFVTILCCYVNKFFRIIIWGVILISFNIYYVIPVISPDNYSYDTDEYFDLKNSCKDNIDCLAGMVKRFQDEIIDYYRYFSQQKYWKYSFQGWREDVVNICTKYRQEYNKQNCIYDYSFRELHMLRKLKYQDIQTK